MFSSNLCLISTQRLTFLDQENSRNCVSGGVTFKFKYKTTGKNYRTLLNSVTDICGRYEIVASIMENIQKNVYSGIYVIIKLHDCSLQPTTGLKISLQKLLTKETMF